MTRRKLALLAAIALVDAVLIWWMPSVDVFVSIMPGVHTTFFTLVDILINVLFLVALLLVAIGAGSRAAWGRFHR